MNLYMITVHILRLLDLNNMHKGLVCLFLLLAWYSKDRIHLKFPIQIDKSKMLNTLLEWGFFHDQSPYVIPQVFPRCLGFKPIQPNLKTPFF